MIDCIKGKQKPSVLLFLVLFYVCHSGDHVCVCACVHLSVCVKSHILDKKLEMETLSPADTFLG